MTLGRRRAEAIDNLRAAARKSTLDLDAAVFVKALRGESDRGAIILGATMVDDRLRHELGKIAKSTRAQLGGFQKRIDQSFASRIELARNVGLVAPATADLIEVVREMRNACAHGREKLTFRSRAIVEALDCLLAHDSASLRKCTPAVRRDVFVVVCGVLAATISGGISSNSLASIEPILTSVTGSVPKWVRRR